MGERSCRYCLLSQMGETGVFTTFSAFFLSWSSDFPRRASWSLTNLRFARRCCGVWACTIARVNVLSTWTDYREKAKIPF